MNIASLKSNLSKRLFAPVDASSLVVFRMGFGLIMLWEVLRYWSHGWISRYFIEPTFFFKYYGFEWVQAWDGNGMYIHFVLLGILAICITVGFMYRLSALLFTLAFSYIFLLDQARYLNHFYLVILFSSILIVLPAQRYFSIDALIKPQRRSETVPAWSIWLLRIQLEIILIYAGLVKINYDWLHLQPLSMWLAERSDLPVVGVFFNEPWAIAIAAYGVIALHLIGAPLLLWKKTRIYVFFIYFAFHLLNHFVFSIGIFPWFTLFATLLFFEPDWPKQLTRRLRARFKKLNTKNLAEFENSPRFTATQNFAQKRWVYAFLSLWLGLQIFVPLRHWLYPGDVSWTEEGHRFSWRMKLRSKQGLAVFYVTDFNTAKTVAVHPKDLLTRRQARKMPTRPDMILQFAHYLRDDWAVKQGINQPIVNANVFASLNGRAPARLIDASVDLAKVERNLVHADWILPLTVPLSEHYK
ncbi:MAG: HTTM domain-containing protein [Thiohalomonadales bacterium]